MCASLGLFYVKGNGDLVPIAIQLHQQPSPDNPIWTPNDSDLDWICAKFWLRNADTQYHQVTIHIFPFNGDLKSRTNTRTRLSQYQVVRAHKTASFWRENVIAVVILQRPSENVVVAETMNLSGV